MQPVVARSLTHRYSPEPAAPVLNAVDLALSAGEFVILSGPTGSGKSTLITLVGALRRHQEGSLQVLGRDLKGAAERVLIELRREIGFIFQDHHLFDALTARETLRLAMRLKAGYRPEDFSERPARWLERVGLAGRMDHRPVALSTGQRQCVAIARALVNEPRLILADEPTASLDASAAAIALDCLREAVSSRGAAVLMITHDSRHFARADRVVRLLDGRVSAA
jgi:putative ABC transport system ATP-binding protein